MMAYDRCTTWDDDSNYYLAAEQRRSAYLLPKYLLGRNRNKIGKKKSHQQLIFFSYIVRVPLYQDTPRGGELHQLNYITSIDGRFTLTCAFRNVAAWCH